MVKKTDCFAHNLEEGWFSSFHPQISQLANLEVSGLVDLSDLGNQDELTKVWRRHQVSLTSNLLTNCF
ncbi:hypothetical protein ACFX15_007621 [Malus domestica]